MHLEDIREPRIDNQLVEQFPSLQDDQGVPLAISLNARNIIW